MGRSRSNGRARGQVRRECPNSAQEERRIAREGREGGHDGQGALVGPDELHRAVAVADDPIEMTRVRSRNRNDRGSGGGTRANTAAGTEEVSDRLPRPPGRRGRGDATWDVMFQTASFEGAGEAAGREAKGGEDTRPEEDGDEERVHHGRDSFRVSASRTTERRRAEREWSNASRRARKPGVPGRPSSRRREQVSR